MLLLKNSLDFCCELCNTYPVYRDVGIWYDEPEFVDQLYKLDLFKDSNEILFRNSRNKFDSFYDIIIIF